jgi:hypothetical protein
MKVKRQAYGISTGVEEYLNQEQRTELVHGGQRPVGGVVYRSSKALPQVGQRTGAFGEVGEGAQSMFGGKELFSKSRSSRRAAKSRRWEAPKKPNGETHLPPDLARQDCVKPLFLPNGRRIPAPKSVRWSRWY